MYTFTVLNKGIKEGQMYITVQFSDGVSDTFNRVYYFVIYDDVSFNQLVQNELTRLNGLKTACDLQTVDSLQSTASKPVVIQQSAIAPVNTVTTNP